MVNKEIFFIWIGKGKPKFVDWTVNVYKEVNPTFKVNLVEIDDPLTTSNKDFLELASIVRKDKYVEKFSEHIEKITHDNKWIIDKVIKPRRLSFLCDLLKQFLLFKYGDITIDTDTFPTKPFDNDLLNLVNDEYKYITPKDDVYLICAEKGYNSLSFSPSKFHRNIPNVNVHKSFKFLEYKEKFLNCELKYGESLFSTKQEDYSKWDWKYYKYYYLDHYLVRSWKNESNEDKKEEENKFYDFLGL